MMTKMGLATALVATAASGGAMAQTIGHVSAFYTGTNPKLIVSNMSSNAFGDLTLEAFHAGNLVDSLNIGSLPAAAGVSTSGVRNFLLGNGGSSAMHPLSKTDVAGITSNDTFKLVAAGLQSAVFGDSPDWLGLTNTPSVNGAQNLALLFAVPEPATILILSAGIAGVAASRRRRR